MLGVVHVPVSGVSYVGRHGEGAWKVTGDGEAKAILVQAKRQRRARVAGSRSHAGDSLKRFLERLGDHEIVSMGSSLKFCLLAEGRADFYPRLGPTSEWDTGAAHAVVRGAGGRIVTRDGEPLRYNLKESFLNPEFLVIADHSVNWLSAFRDD